MIEVEINDDDSQFPSGQIRIDGISNPVNAPEIFIQRHYARTKNDVSGFAISIFDDELANTLAKRDFSELSQDILKMELSTGCSLIEEETEIQQNLTIYRKDTGEFYLSLDFDFFSDDWKRLWSITEYKNEFIRILESENLTNGPYKLGGVIVEESEPDPEEAEIAILFPVPNPEAGIHDEAKKHSALLKRLHARTTASLLSKLRSDSVVLQFDFPDEAKIACEQYLLYFVQFLKDLGVEASAELRHEAGEVLFAVTPKDKEEALDKIRTALSVYLNLPASNIDGVEIDVLTQRLASNVYHLKSQLALTHAVLQAKDATLQAQQFTIVQQERLLSGELMIDSIVEFATEPPKMDREQVLNGIAEITKYEGKGFSVNLPEIYRRLRRLFDERD